MTAVSHAYELEHSQDYVHHRGAWTTLWLIQAISQARAAHWAHFGHPPHTVYMGPDEHRRLMTELGIWSDRIPHFAGAALRVLGMLVVVEAPR